MTPMKLVKVLVRALTAHCLSLNSSIIVIYLYQQSLFICAIIHKSRLIIANTLMRMQIKRLNNIIITQCHSHVNIGTICFLRNIPLVIIIIIIILLLLLKKRVKPKWKRPSVNVITCLGKLNVTYRSLIGPLAVVYLVFRNLLTVSLSQLEVRLYDYHITVKPTSLYKLLR